ncbi:MAG: UDP-N-acetylmuramate--L-alanine ligase [Chloroflexi bacterium]|nr:UDP-N-acetylmuramate--L-alanine ligase [Chloroflexota bacterium]
MHRGQTVWTATRLHLVGINGSGMSSLAGLLLDLGKQVSGSDLSPGQAATHLQARGARVQAGHAAEHVEGAELVVISSAVQADNPEVQAARGRGIRVIKHAQALGELMRGRYGIAVAGTHGKSTTTALAAFLLDRAGLQPTLIGGAESLDFGASSRLGQSDYVVVEADEYDRRFLELSPRLAIVTSIEPDHLDYFADLDEIADAFRAFTRLLPEDGLAVTCHDDPVLRGLDVPCPRLSYGFEPGAAYHVAAYRALPGQPVRFTLRAPDDSMHAFQLGLLGRHNVANACAALAAARAVGVDWEALQEALPRFRGTRRRFERVGETRGVLVVDDYAHHPTAVRATLRAAHEWHAGPVWVAFQPHTTHRTAALLDDFAAALGVADRVVVLPIYQPAGREYARQEVSAADLAARVPSAASVCASLEAAAEQLAREAPSGTLLLTMGAGDVTRLGPLVLAALKERRP